MSKKLLIFINVMIVSVALNGMDLKLHNLKRTQTVGGSDSRRKEGDENKHDVRLNFSDLPEPLPLSKNGKQSVKNLQHVKNLQNQQETYRASTGRGSSDVQKETINVLEANNDNRVINNNNLIVNHNEDDGGDNVQTKRRSVLGALSSNNAYSSEDMWNILKKANPQLFEYATENHLSLNEVLNCAYDFEVIDPTVERVLKKFEKKKPLTLDAKMEYKHLLDNFDITPDAVADFVQKHHDLSDAYKQELAKKFEDRLKKDPNQRLALALDFISRTLDEDGIKEPSPIHAAHVAIQKDTISEQKSQIWYQYIALGVTFATTIAGYAWAIYGQVSGTATNAPTSSPTTAPTGFPTGAPI